MARAPGDDPISQRVAAVSGTESASAQVTAAVTAALAPAGRVRRAGYPDQPARLGGSAARPSWMSMPSCSPRSARPGRQPPPLWCSSGRPPAPRMPRCARICSPTSSRQYGNLAHLRNLIRRAHASVPQRQFIPGVTPPGTSPAIEAGNERAAAVRDAILDFARYTALRSRLTVVVAARAALAVRTLAEARARRQAGEHVVKRWEARQDGKACHWCRNLHGVDDRPGGLVPALSGRPCGPDRARASHCPAEALPRGAAASPAAPALPLPSCDCPRGRGEDAPCPGTIPVPAHRAVHHRRSDPGDAGAPVQSSDRVPARCRCTSSVRCCPGCAHRWAALPAPDAVSRAWQQQRTTGAEHRCDQVRACEQRLRASTRATSIMTEVVRPGRPGEQRRTGFYWR